MPATNGRKKRLTPKQFAVFKFIRDQISTSGVPPSRKEIADHFGFSSPNAAESHLRALERKGLISTVPHQARGIRLEVASAPKSSLPKAEKNSVQKLFLLSSRTTGSTWVLLMFRKSSR